jgi:perosamine synthetase
MYTICVEKKIRDIIVNKLNQDSINASVHFCPPVHLHSYYKGHYNDKDLSTTEKLSEEIISIPIFPDMDDSEVEYVCSVFERIYKGL